MVIKVLCVKQPWAWAIIDAGKDVENRTWKTSYKGRLYISASKTIDHDGYGAILEASHKLPVFSSFYTGGIIGHVNLLDCIKTSTSEWAEPNQWHWLLSSPERINFIPIKGQLGIFNYNINI